MTAPGEGRSLEPAKLFAFRLILAQLLDDGAQGARVFDELAEAGEAALPMAIPDDINGASTPITRTRALSKSGMC